MLGRIPSSSDYHRWCLNSRRRARETGQSTRPYVHYASVLRRLAPDRSAGNGWRLVIQRALTDS
jgi:hypothetical protein